MSKLTQTRDAYGHALLELGGLNDQVVVLDADLYRSTRTVHFRDAYPDRFVDIGISEMDLMSTGAGLATTGLIPYVNSFAMFLTAHCYDQVRLGICYPNLHVVLAASSAGLTQGPDGASHQSLEDIALMRALPNMRVLVPADAVETRAMTLAAATEVDGPVYLRLGRYPVPELFDETYTFELGKAVRLRSGSDITLFACGHMVSAVLKAAEILATQGVEASVLNMSTIKPLDEEAVRQAMSETRLVVTVEEHSIIGGLGSAVAEVMAECDRGAPLLRLGTRDVFGESATADELLEKHLLTPRGIAAEVIQRTVAN